MASEKYV